MTDSLEDWVLINCYFCEREVAVKKDATFINRKFYQDVRTGLCIDCRDSCRRELESIVNKDD